MNFRAGMVFVDDGFRVGLVACGHKWEHVIYQDGSRVRSARMKGPVPVRDLAGVTPSRLAREWQKKKNLLGLPQTITRGVRVMLRKAAA